MLPLKGLKVLDFSHAADGPICALMLAEAGAEVIKIEPLQGDPYRRSNTVQAFYTANRSKRSLSLNLRTKEGKEITRKLISDSDIIVESFTPGVADALGIGYGDVSNINPRLIYCSLSGFGQTGPYSKRPVYDPVTQAMSGFMATTGEPGRPPVRVAPYVIGLGTAFLAAYGVVLAVLERQKTGKGQHVDAAFFDTAIFFMSPFLTRYSFNGMVTQRMGSANAVFVPYQCFETADRYVFIGVANDQFWHSFCRALGFSDIESDSRYVTNEKRLEHRDELIGGLSAALKKFSSNDLLARLEAAGVPCAPVLEIPEVISDPQVQARQMLVDTEYPGVGKMKVARIPVRTSDTSEVNLVRAPLLGEHTREILLGLGYMDADIDSLERTGVIFKG